MNKENVIICASSGLIGVGIACLIQYYRIKKLKKKLNDSSKSIEYLKAYLDTIVNFDNQFYKDEA